MISRTPSSWQTELACAYRSPEALLRRLGLDPAQVELPADAAGFPLLVPESYAARMRPGDPDDPLLRQVLPAAAELAAAPGDLRDPVGDLGAAVIPGLLRKYRGRALVVATGACAVHCRYCFRRHYPYGDHQAGNGQWQAIVDHLAADPEVHEVILSGGDPLTLADARLARLTGQLAAIPHLRRLRLHTRVPVVLPSRVDANHAAELDAAVAAAVARLRPTGALLLNQAVLLRGINDDPAQQEALCERLGELGVLPYYLHLLDPVAGAAHFAVADTDALALQRHLRTRLPGYLVPRLVREVPGAPYKVPLEAGPC